MLARMPPLDAWQPFSPREVAGFLAGVAVPWYIAGGWALDLFRGEPSREHADLEIAIPPDQLAIVRARPARFRLFVPGDGGITPLAADDEPPAARHQIWVREPRTGMFRLDIFLEPGEDDCWISRRDARLRRPYRDLIRHTRDGIP